MGNSPRDCGPGGQWLGFLFFSSIINNKAYYE